jgi:Kelch motif
MKALRSLRRGAALAAVPTAIAAPAASGSEPAWRQIAPAPAPRQEVSYAALGGQIYLAAGNDRSQQRYDPLTDSWTEVAELPASFEGLDHVNGVAVDGKLVYAGGLSEWEYPFPVSSETAIYDPASDSFSSGADMSSPRAAGGVAAWHGKLIYAGGLGPEGSVARVDAYDPLTDEWARLEDMPRPRDHFQAAIVGDELYAIGGRRTVLVKGGVEIEDTATVDALDLADGGNLATAEWSANVTSLPTPRGGLGVAAIGECVYAIGGERVAGTPDEVTGIVESYDTSDGLWRELPSLAIPRHGIQAAAIGKTIYVAGGGTESFDYAPTAAHEALDVSATGPCTAVEAEAEQGSAPQGLAGPGPPAAGRGVLRISYLAVRPRRVLLSGPPHRGGAKIVLFLSRAGWVSLRLPGHFHCTRRLRAGRNVLPLPIHAHGRPLPPGRYRLVATPRPTGGGRPVRAAFRVVR